MILGIDLSKRSTAAVLINMKGELVDFLLINPAKEIDGEELMIYQWVKLSAFINKHKESLKAIAVEGLSFNSLSSERDKLIGLHWIVRFSIAMYYPEILLGVIAPQSWYNWAVTKQERTSMTGKDARKKIVVSKLPYVVRMRFEEYVRTLGVKKEAVYDLSDAVNIALYRLSLEETK